MEYGLDKRHKATFKVLFDKLAQKHGQCSIFGFGSYFDSKVTKFSDVDIFLISETAAHSKFFINVDDLCFDITTSPTILVKRKILKSDPFFIDVFTSSVLLKDPLDIFYELQNLARNKYENRIVPELTHSTYSKLIRSRIRTLLQDMESAIGDESKFNLIFASLIFTLRDATRLSRGELPWPTLRAKNAYQEIAESLPHEAERLKEVNSYSCSQRRYDSAFEISLRIIAPLGGLIKENEIIFYQK